MIYSGLKLAFAVRVNECENYLISGCKRNILNRTVYITVSKVILNLLSVVIPKLHVVSLRSPRLSFRRKLFNRQPNGFLLKDRTWIISLLS